MKDSFVYIVLLLNLFIFKLSLSCDLLSLCYFFLFDFFLKLYFFLRLSFFFWYDLFLGMCLLFLRLALWSYHSDVFFSQLFVLLFRRLILNLRLRFLFLRFWLSWHNQGSCRPSLSLCSLVDWLLGPASFQNFFRGKVLRNLLWLLRFWILVLWNLFNHAPGKHVLLKIFLYLNWIISFNLLEQLWNLGKKIVLASDFLKNFHNLLKFAIWLNISMAEGDIAERTSCLSFWGFLHSDKASCTLLTESVVTRENNWNLKDSLAHGTRKFLVKLLVGVFGNLETMSLRPFFKNLPWRVIFEQVFTLHSFGRVAFFYFFESRRFFFLFFFLFFILFYYHLFFELG